jgi:peptide/nickel transport system substrate-binding protein
MRSRTSRPPHRSARRLLGLVVVGAVALAACGDDDDDSADSVASESTTAVTAATTTEETASDVTTGTTGTTSGSSEETVPAERCAAPEEAASETTTGETTETDETTGDTTDGSTDSSDPSVDTTSGTSETTDATDTTEDGASDSTDARNGLRRPATAPSSDDPAVVVSAILEPTSLDLVSVAGAAIDQALLDNVYETLLQLGTDGEIEAGLAELPEVSEDGTVYTFTLQDGPTFHSGEPLVADDVVWSLEQQTATGANEADRLASIDTVEASDDRTVVVTLCQPDNDFLYLMTRRGGAVLQADATDLDNSANGTGPFVLEDGGWNVGSSLTLTRNDDYWGELPAISEVTFQYFTDQNAMVNAFTTGDVDIVTGIQSDLIEPLQANPDYVVNEGTTNGEFTLGFNNEREPFTDPEVRRAIRQAIDKEGYRELNNGFGTLIGGPVPPSDPWYEDLTDVAPYDPDAARAALEEAGYGDGLELTLTWPNLYATSNADYVASQLAEVGVDVTVEAVEFSVWLEQVYTNHDYDMTAVLHVEPRDIVNYANPDYYWQYDNPEVQELIGAAKVNPDPDEAEEQLREAARMISEDSPVDWLLLAADLTVSTPDVTGYPTDDTGSRFDASGITVTE